VFHCIGENLNRSEPALGVMMKKMKKMEPEDAAHVVAAEDTSLDNAPDTGEHR
jgi:hypothetical protein